MQENINSIGGVNVFLPFFETLEFSSQDSGSFSPQSISVEDYSDMTESAMTNFRNVSGTFFEVDVRFLKCLKGVQSKSVVGTVRLQVSDKMRRGVDKVIFRFANYLSVNSFEQSAFF